jgi:predicted XRE-type DNA-binding protein
MEQAKDIRRLYEVAKLSQYQIADLFDTSQAVINGIVNYKTYTKEAA